MPFDLLVFDNASCEQVRDFLLAEHAAGRIQYLTLSNENAGKAAAWNFAFAAAPGEIIAYADADIRFEPGWLENLVAVLDAYPEAGMVTGIPMWSPAEFSTATIEWAERTEGVTLQRGKLLPWEDYRTHARSLGQSEEEARANYDNQTDLMIEDGRQFPVVSDQLSVNSGQSAATGESLGNDRELQLEPGTRNLERFFVGAGHFQFVTRKKILLEVLPIPADRPMGQVRRLDAAINAAGYLRLSTPDWWVRHLGNAPENLGTTAASETPGPRLRGPLRALVQWVYHRAFELLYRS
jgi:glycosyltransferase involved in cell wall biosynthesis